MSDLDPTSRRLLQPAILATVVALVLAGSGLSARATPLHGPPVSGACYALNPGHPTCTMRVRETPDSNRSGWSGIGTWRVTVYRGAKVFRFKNAMIVERHVWELKVGDRVRAEALTPGSYVHVAYYAP